MPYRFRALLLLCVLALPATNAGATYELALDEPVGAVLSTGPDTRSGAGWEITPTRIEFPITAVDKAAYSSMTITNTGTEPLQLDVGFADTTAGFFVRTSRLHPIGLGEYTLHPGSVGEILLGFSPPDVGKHRTRLLLGRRIPPVQLLGEGFLYDYLCDVEPTELFFGPVVAGTEATQTFEVFNAGSKPLTVEPVPSDPRFLVTPIQVVIESRTVATFQVEFAPAEPGTWDCVIDLGTEFCTPVHCLGDAIGEPLFTENVIGCYFDEELTTSAIDTPPFTMLTTYLALSENDPSAEVSGWDCLLGSDTPGSVIITQAVPVGDSINLAYAPGEFDVHLSEPLPCAPDGILLAEVTFLLMTADPVVLTLEPRPESAVPGAMIWRTPEGDPIPMYTATGTPEAAYINTEHLGLDDQPADDGATPRAGSVAVTRLLPNAPNPFNPQTEIRFELSQDGPARVTIHDVTGRRVRALVNESLAAGPQSRIWNGTDDAGRRVASGAYYVRLETDGKIDHHKIMLLK